MPLLGIWFMEAARRVFRWREGEAPRIQRAADGSAARMVWAGYPVTREPGPWKAPE